MTRTGAYKVIYFSILAGVFLLAVGVAEAGKLSGVRSAVASFAVIAVLLLPGRLQAYFWSELLAGLHHLNQRNYQISKAHSERFLVQLLERPWLKSLNWLGPSSYSRNAEVLALNNLGAAELKLGELDAARTHLARAIELDPACPLPYQNMGALTLRTATYAEALPWFEKAVALGLKGDWTDRVVTASQRHHASRSTVGTMAVPLPLADQSRTPPAGDFVVELLNDGTTPFEFVIGAMERVFGMTGVDAVRITKAVHQDGRAVCAAFDSREAAQAKVDELAALAGVGNVPLKAVVRPARD